MDTFRYFWSGQTATRDANNSHTSSSAPMTMGYHHESRNSTLGSSSGLRDDLNINQKSYNIENAKDIKPKDADKYFYILWHS
ncbi:uncharacterized protein isoform X1 [Musca autumnalis]|uniref:uncharacterized protein isoform X1 n=1 Tax=Musca autumnalis TaxID=221902 RepID=UPI003CE9A4B9